MGAQIGGADPEARQCYSSKFTIRSQHPTHTKTFLTFSVSRWKAFGGNGWTGPSVESGFAGLRILFGIRTTRFFPPAPDDRVVAIGLPGTVGLVEIGQDTLARLATLWLHCTDACITRIFEMAGHVGFSRSANRNRG